MTTERLEPVASPPIYSAERDFRRYKEFTVFGPWRYTRLDPSGTHEITEEEFWAATGRKYDRPRRPRRRLPA